jgi:GNAT superfamily N-acetyltransferase
MSDYMINKIEDLSPEEITEILLESKKEGFRFVERLLKDYLDGTNKFNKTGEALYGIYNKEKVLLAVGGLNIDPFSNETSVGRVRRFYVKKEYRQNGLGKLLLQQIITEAKVHFQVLVLHTDTEQAAQFYQRLGFTKRNLYQNSTHYLYL